MMRGIDLMLQLQGELGCRIPVGMLDRVQFQNTYFFYCQKQILGTTIRRFGVMIGLEYFQPNPSCESKRMDWRDDNDHQN